MRIDARIKCGMHETPKPSASHSVVQSLVDLLDGGTTIITANNRSAAWIREVFDAHQQQRGLAAWSTSLVLPWQTKLTHEVAKYQETPKDDQKCSTRIQFVTPASCKLVVDPISPDGPGASFTERSQDKSRVLLERASERQLRMHARTALGFSPLLFRSPRWRERRQPGRIEWA